MESEGFFSTRGMIPKYLPAASGVTNAEWLASASTARDNEPHEAARRSRVERVDGRTRMDRVTRRAVTSFRAR